LYVCVGVLLDAFGHVFRKTFDRARSGRNFGGRCVSVAGHLGTCYGDSPFRVIGGFDFRRRVGLARAA
jgi:hypothetical protein